MERKRAIQHNQMVIWARNVINNKGKYVILDTETTGLGKNDVIVQIGITDVNGNILLESLVKPSKRKRISKDATAIHGIHIKILENMPSFKDLYGDFIKIIKGKTVLIYNAEFDIRLLMQTVDQDGFSLKNFYAECVMKAYSVFIGEWSNHHNDFKFQKLRGGNHSAIGDCKATIQVIKEMADADLFQVPKRWWEFWKNNSVKENRKEIKVEVGKNFNIKISRKDNTIQQPQIGDNIRIWVKPETEMVYFYDSNLSPNGILLGTAINSFITNHINNHGTYNAKIHSLTNAYATINFLLKNEYRIPEVLVEENKIYLSKELKKKYKPVKGWSLRFQLKDNTNLKDGYELKNNDYDYVINNSTKHLSEFLWLDNSKGKRISMNTSGSVDIKKTLRAIYSEVDFKLKYKRRDGNWVYFDVVL
jgi:DNA polymerase-3 subunit epsilon